MQRIFLFLYFFLIAKHSFTQLPIGNWREHLPYHQAIAVATNNSIIFAATPYSLFTVNTADNSIERFSKINGLHETGISTIQFDEKNGSLVVAYSNSNIDILSGGKIRNIDAIKRKDLPADKTIYNIFCFQDKAYLASGLGIIVLDELKYEVKDTYIIGNGGAYLKVNGVTADANFLYAATPDGVKKAPLDATNLADYRNWTLISTSDGLPAGAYQQAILVEGKIVVQQANSLYALNGSAWSLLYNSDWQINNTTVSSKKILLSQQRANEKRVLVLNPDGTVSNLIQQPANIIQPRQAIIRANETWIADSATGLLRVTGNTTERFIPNSPYALSTAEMFASNETLWMAGGNVSSVWTNTNSRNGFFGFGKNEWTNYNVNNIKALDSLPDIVTIAVDPRTKDLWAGSFGGGLLQWNNNTASVYKQNHLDNSLSDPGKYNVSGLAFDNETNLWIAKYGALQNLSVRKTDGNWKKFFIPFFHTNNAVSQIIVDDLNQKWILSPNGNGLFCFNHGNSIDNSSDDRWKFYQSGQGNGNLPDNDVRSIAKDKNGFIWVGTAKGIGIIQCPQQVFTTQGCEAVLPVVQQDNFAGYLFRDEVVQAIAVDGADRKWIGTTNGVWLISEAGEKTIYRFTVDNSPLLGNDVKKIAIDGKTGEVFFATTNGLCSFSGTSTEGSETNSDVKVFPNPVPPGYNGTIAIRGLVNNAIVKITELDGRLVYQTKALGGQAIWNGKDYRGRNISTGVYLVLVSDDSRKERMVTKIVFIGK